MRERGLKLSGNRRTDHTEHGRSREGAWIEIDGTAITLSMGGCRSREGAWIEILKLKGS